MARPPERLFRLVFEPHDGRALSADSEEKREPARDIETATVESLKVLDTQWPIREADIAVHNFKSRKARVDIGLFMLNFLL